MRGDEELMAQYVKDDEFDYNAYLRDEQTRLALSVSRAARHQQGGAKQQMQADGEQDKYMPDGKTFLYIQYVKDKEAEEAKRAGGGEGKEGEGCEEEGGEGAGEAGEGGGAGGGADDARGAQRGGEEDEEEGEERCQLDDNKRANKAIDAAKKDPKYDKKAVIGHIAEKLKTTAQAEQGRLGLISKEKQNETGSTVSGSTATRR